MRTHGAGGSARLSPPGNPGLEPARDLVPIPGEHLRGAGAVVEPHERLADDEAAFRQPTAFAGQRHGRLESRHVVVGEVADDGQPQLLGFIESDDPRAGTHPRMTAEPSPLDRLENEARGSRIAQAQVRPERGEEVGVDRRRHRSPKRKRPPGGGLGQNRWVLWPSARSRIAHGATRPRCERRSSPRAYPRSVSRERRPAGLASWSQVSYCDSRPE